MIQPAGVGYEFKSSSQRNAFYIYDPEARSPEDLTENLSNRATFHIKSNISGKILSFLVLGNFPEENQYHEIVKNNLQRTILNGGRDSDIESILPNISVERSNPSPINPSGRNSGSFTSYYPTLKWDSFNTYNNDIVGENQPVGPYPSKKEAYEQGISHLARLHHDESMSFKIPSEATDKLLDLVGTIEDKVKERTRSAIPITTRHSSFDYAIQSIKHVINSVRDGEFHLVKDESGISYNIHHGDPDRKMIYRHRASSTVNGMVSSVEALLNYAMTDLDPRFFEEEILSLIEISNEFARHTEHSLLLGKVITNVSLDLNRDISEGYQNEPDVIAASQMTCEENPLLTPEHFLNSGIFSPQNMERLPMFANEDYTPISLKLYDISSIKNPEVSRNLIQLYQKISPSPLRIDFSDRPNGPIGAESTLSIGTRGDIVESLLKGHSPRDTIPASLSKKLSLLNGATPRFSKRDVEVFFDNVIACDRLIAYDMENIVPASRVVLRTHSGESVHFTPNSDESKTTDITFYDNNNEEVFSKAGVERRAKVIGRSNRNLYQTINKPTSLIGLSSGKIKNYDDLYAVMDCLHSNIKLDESSTNGYLAAIASVRDRQGRKVRQHDYSSWIDDALKGREHREKHYQSTRYAADADNISEAISVSAFLKLAYDHGIDIRSKVDINFIIDADNVVDLSESFIFDGHPVDLTFITDGLRLNKNPNIINYKKQVVDASERIHIDSSRMAKSHLPSVSLEWQPSTPNTPLGVLDTGEQVIAKPLSSYRDIQNEGAEMGHCAGTYSGPCMKGQYYLWSIVAADHKGNERRISTLGITHDFDTLEFDQHYGHNNTLPPDDVDRMVKEFSHSITHTSNYPSHGEPTTLHRDPHSSEYNWDPESDDAIAPGSRINSIVDFTPTSATDADIDFINDHNITEVITNYRWQTDIFKSDAMNFLFKSYGKDRVIDTFIRQVDAVVLEAENYGTSLPREDYKILMRKIGDLRSSIESLSHDNDEEMSMSS